MCGSRSPLALSLPPRTGAEHTSAQRRVGAAPPPASGSPCTHECMAVPPPLQQHHPSPEAVCSVSALAQALSAVLRQGPPGGGALRWHVGTRGGG
eukprot:1296955-Prymnesium_polylepis.2